jgi:NifB/MoaA-like Fe-S oxidoreductase
MQRLRTLADADIEFNIQIVLCPGINDGEVLSHTLSDLKEFLDNIISISVVPVGLTKYHKEGLKPYDRDQATRVLKLIDRVRSDHEASAGRCFVCASDEFYLLSDRAIPEGDYYEGFNQYEDGVGMARTFLDNLQSQNFNDFVNKLNLTDVAIATGELGYKVLSPIMSDYLSVVAVQNEFFGPNITATGLVVGSDLIHTLKDIPQSVVIIPDNMLNDEGYFLDGQRVEDVEKVLGKKVIVALLDGSNIIDILEEVGK